MRHTLLRGFAVLALVVSLLLVLRVLPADAIRALVARVTEPLGWWGPVAFAGLYALATVALLPGSILTLAAGAVFGLALGFAVVSVGATVGASLAFLIARHVARSKVEQVAASNPKFGAIDAAIRDGGWKIVGLLRLSPAVPFNLQNYLYGLTDLKFWPYVLTSWIAMMPGTFLYVYLGVVAGSVAATDATSGGADVWRWVLLGVGLLATIVVTIYVTKLAKEKLAEQTALAEESGESSPAESEENPAAKTLRYGLAAVVAVAVAAVATWQKQTVQDVLTGWLDAIG